MRSKLAAIITGILLVLLVTTGCSDNAPNDSSNADATASASPSVSVTETAEPELFTNCPMLHGVDLSITKPSEETTLKAGTITFMVDVYCLSEGRNLFEVDLTDKYYLGRTEPWQNKQHTKAKFVSTDVQPGPLTALIVTGPADCTDWLRTQTSFDKLRDECIIAARVDYTVV